MKLLYFAWVRQKIGLAGEDFAETGVETVLDVIAVLRARGGGYEEAFRDPARLRCAVNQVHASFETRVGGSDELAFFPPVTGG